MPLSALVVGVEPQVARVLDGVLREMSIKAQRCQDGSQAALQLVSESFDLVIVDCKDEAAALWLIGGIRQSKPNKGALVVALLGSSNNVRSIFATGCNFVLYKPISAARAIESLRAARGLMRREKRKSKRVRLSGKASIAYATVENQSARLLDLSEDGVSIQTEIPLPARCKIYFQFNLPGHVSTVRLSGETTWQDDSGHVGLRFMDVPKASRRVLSEWLRSSAGMEVEIKPDEQPEVEGKIEPDGKSGLGLLHVSASDRRVKTRHACRLSADVSPVDSKVPTRCTLTDISTGGCYVETTVPYPVTTALEIVVRTQDVKLHVLGTVQTVHPGFGMGMEFSLKTEDQREQVEQLIACAAENAVSV